MNATILRFKQSDPIIGAHADVHRDDLMFAREQRRDTHLDVKSPPPFKPSILRNWLGAIVARLAA